MGNKFILEGDEINTNNKPDEQEVNEKGETEIKWRVSLTRIVTSCMHPNRLFLGVNMMQEIRKYLRDTCQNIGNYWMEQKKGLSEKIFII